MTNNIVPIYNTIQEVCCPCVIPEKIKIYFDGAAEPTNPGIASYGWVILDMQDVEISNGFGIPSAHASNNFAEYCGIGFALRWLKDKGWTGETEIYGDSQLVIYQISGDWKCNKSHLIALRDKCRQLLNQIGNKHVLKWIPREYNYLADALSQKAFVQGTGKTFPLRKKKS